MQQETNLKEGRDPRHCDLYDTGPRTLMTMLVILLIGVYVASSSSRAGPSSSSLP